MYPTIVMAAVMDILGIPHDGFDYDFENHVLRLSDTTGTVVREIPIDDHGNMFVNFYGLSKTFYYISYMYSFDPEMLPPNYWQDKVALVGTSLAGLFDLRSGNLSRGRDSRQRDQQHSKERVCEAHGSRTKLFIYSTACYPGGGNQRLSKKTILGFCCPDCRGVVLDGIYL